MRQHGKRPALEVTVLRRLSRETKLIVASPTPREEAVRRYNKARQAKWFEQVVKALHRWAGPGSRCMYCSGSESAEVEHYYPKSVFPHLAMTWGNFLWICGICNRAKGDRFPPTTEAGELIINPGDESVWEYFFIDEFGNLTPLWRSDLGMLEQRATITESILKLNRQALQEARQSRMHDLRQKVEDTLALHSVGQLTQHEIIQRINKWRMQPFQPDVADYFLLGPGRREKPFKDLIALVEAPATAEGGHE